VTLFCRPSDLNGNAGIQKGETKVFLRQNAFEYIEKFRNDTLTKAALPIQAMARRFLSRCSFLSKMALVVQGQAFIRRFLACKFMLEFRRNRSAARMQAWTRLKFARQEFVSKKYTSTWLQKFYRGHIGRKNYKMFYEQHKTAMAINDLNYRSVVAIQCMYRMRVARQAYAELRKMGRRDSHVLEGKALKAAIKADRAAAIANESAFQRKKEVGDLQSRLDGAKNSAEKAKFALEELKSVKAELAVALAELEVANLATEGAMDRAAKLEGENSKLKENIKSGNFDSAEVYRSAMYHDHPDIKSLDERMFGITARSKKSKADMRALAEALKILL
jgi:myosin heavy subunit